MCNEGGDGDEGGGTGEAIQEQYDTTDPDTFADHWGIDTETGGLTPTEGDAPN